MKNIRLFENKEQYTSYKESENAVYPHACLTTSDNKVYVDGGIKLINFTIEGYGTFQAVEGMTWKEWCNSEYNINNYAFYELYQILVVLYDTVGAGISSCNHYYFIVENECHDNDYSTFPMNGVIKSDIIKSKNYNVCLWLEGVGCSTPQ